MVAAEGIRILYAGAALVACLVGIYFIRDVVAPVFLAITLVQFRGEKKYAN